MLCFTQQPLKKCHRIHKCEGKQQYCTGKGTQLQKICTLQGRIQDFKLGGAHLKKLRRAEGGAKMFGVFRVKNHDFTPKKSYFFQFWGGRTPGVPPPLNPPLHCQNLNKKKNKKF